MSTTRPFRIRGGPGSGPHPGNGPKKPEPKPKPKAEEKPAGEGKSKSEIAKAAHVLVGKDIQRYSEEHNEPVLAKGIGGVHYKDNEPIDVGVKDASGKLTHGVELKTIIANKAGKITMSGEALARKRTWARKEKAPFHTVVFDDTQVYNALGPGKHDESKRVILYRRGAGSFRIGKMYKCKDMNEVKTLMNTPVKKLPEGAK